MMSKAGNRLVDDMSQFLFALHEEERKEFGFMIAPYQVSAEAAQPDAFDVAESRARIRLLRKIIARFQSLSSDYYRAEAE